MPSDPPTLYPYFGYRDAAAAVEWLEAALGFARLAVHADDDGVVVHGEMRLGNGVIMLGTTPGRLAEHGRGDHGVYLLVDDVDAHFARAEAAGAEVVFPPEDTAWGTRRYRIRDPEGYEWSVGGYQPGAGG